MGINEFFAWLGSKDHPTDDSYEAYKARMANLETATRVKKAGDLLKGTGHHVIDEGQADKLLKGSR